MKILVTCHHHSPYVSMFPQVRGNLLANGLVKIGHDATFRQLPVEGEFDVVISSEYETENMDWFHNNISSFLNKIKTKTICCLGTSPTYQNYFAMEMRNWFRERGGIFCHLKGGKYAYSNEHYIGIGVDKSKIVVSKPTGVLFDFPTVQGVYERLDRDIIPLIRNLGIAVYGSGPKDAPVKELFDKWYNYGSPYYEYLCNFRDLYAFIPGCNECMGLTAIEAQAHGATILCEHGEIKDEVGVAMKHYKRGDNSLLIAIYNTFGENRFKISQRVLEKFDIEIVARRLESFLVKS